MEFDVFNNPFIQGMISEETCPICGDLLEEDKKTGVIKCSNPKCNFKKQDKTRKRTNPKGY